MAGRGDMDTAAPLDNMGGRLQVLRNGRWQPMYRPVNPDRPFSGTCLAESFAAAYAEEHRDVEVGIIPCADGGTSIDQWREGGLLFDNAVYLTKLALRTSHLVGILWHQGEADCEPRLYPHYRNKIAALMAALRRELDAENIPLIVGGLGDFLKERDPANMLTNYPYINEALLDFAKSTHRTEFVSAAGLTSRPDRLHFNHESLMEFGKRYYEAYKKIEDTERVFDEKSKMDDAQRSAMESL